MTTERHAATAGRAPIRALSPLVVNQIAAGEVVERPASVVKELVENALDAGATRITIEIEAGGVELVRVADDGQGIPADQLLLAVAPHATSKLVEPGELERIGTLGFRGEALASIASVSRMTIRSRTADDAGASTIDASGDERSAVRPASGPVGTVVTVRNLFFNTPARRKFLRTPTTEQGRCLDAVRDLALAHPGVAFRVECDGRVAMDVEGTGSPRDRALAVLGAELEPELLDVRADAFDDSRGVALWGLVGRPAIARATPSAQHVFVNGRPIRDRTIQHALRESYRGLVEPGRHATALLMLEIDPGQVDVNVHPTKAEVRFRDGSLVHGVVLRAVRDALRAADLTPPVLGRAGPDGGAEYGPTTRPGGVAAFVGWFRGAPGAEARLTFDAAREALSHPPREPGPELPTPRPTPRVLQVHNSFLVTQDERGIVIIDQHALHERVMFEQLIERIRAGALESQRLLMPAVVTMPTRHVERLGELAGLLERIGVEAAAVGPDQVAVSAFPSFLFHRGVEPAEFLADLLERTEAEGFAPGGEGALHEVLDLMACKAAVKAGDRLSETELDELVRLRADVERSSNCPHGRPTTVRLTIAELERLFKRR